MQVARRNPPTTVKATTTVQRVLGDMNLPGFQFTDEATGEPLDLAPTALTFTLRAERLMPDADEIELAAESKDSQLGWVGCDWDAFFLQAGLYRLQYVAVGDHATVTSPYIFLEVVDLGEYPISYLGEING